MQTVNVVIPEELVRAAGWGSDDPSSEAVRLLALELYREDKISLERAAELCQMAVERFTEFCVRHIEADRRMLDWLGL